MKSKLLHLTGQHQEPIPLLTTDYEASGIALIISPTSSFDGAEGYLAVKPARTNVTPLRIDTVAPNFAWNYFIGGDVEVWLILSDDSADIDVTLQVSQVY
jgi:hypothetical protein